MPSSRPSSARPSKGPAVRLASLAAMLLCVPLIGCTSPATQQASNSTASDSSGLIATINGDKIDREQFDKQLEMRRGQEVLEVLINEKLIEQEAKKEGVTEDPKELQEKLDELHKDKKYQAEIRQGADPKLIEDSIRIAGLLKKLMLKEITKEDKLRFFDRFKDALVQVKVAQILVTDQKEADRIHDELDHGADFGKEAKKYSKDPSSRDDDGLVGWLVRGQLEKSDFNDTVFSTPIGKISPVVRSPYGYHIIKILDKKTTYDQLESAIEDMLLHQQEKQYEDRLRAKATVSTIYDKDRAAAGVGLPASGSPSGPAASPAASAP